MYSCAAPICADRQGRPPARAGPAAKVRSTARRLSKSLSLRPCSSHATSVPAGIFIVNADGSRRGTNAGRHAVPPARIDHVTRPAGQPGAVRLGCAGHTAITVRRSGRTDKPMGARVTEANDWNSKIIEEFRANGGKVGGQFEGAPLLLLHTVGAKSGQERVNPMMYRTVGDAYAVFASKAGAPTNPDWYYNLVANPRVRAEIGTETLAATARVAEAEERDRIFAAQKDAFPGFGDYERQTTRQIPVVILEAVR